jgi:membrane fusion protein, multidrug efflux system
MGELEPSPRPGRRPPALHFFAQAARLASSVKFCKGPRLPDRLGPRVSQELTWSSAIERILTSAADERDMVPSDKAQRSGVLQKARGHVFLICALGFVLLLLGATATRLGLANNAGAAGAAARPGGGPPAPVVTAFTAVLHPFASEITAIGVAKARQSVTLTAPTTELATKILFTSGQRVAKGQVLAELKSDEQQAAVVNAESMLRKAESDEARWRALDQKGFAPKVQVEQYEAAEQQAKAALDAARSRLRDRVIRAPFSGAIGLSDAAPGMLITPGAPIATLDDLSVIYVDFEVPETSLPMIGVHAPVAVAWDGAPGRLLKGEIRQIDTRIRAETRSLTVRAALPNAGARLRPGMLLKVSLRTGARTAVAAPESAVQFTGDRSFVYVLPGAAARAVAARRPVVTGAHDQGLVEIRTGLSAGERVAADGLNRLRPNQPVRVKIATGAS